MKKIFYALLALLAAAAVVGCEEADNGAATDTAPAVTIYNLALPEGYDADVTCSVRICPNALTEAMYVLTELLTDKEAYVAENGEEAYAAKVVDEGDAYEGETQELVLGNLAGKYAVTVVAVRGNVRTIGEYVFNGIAWAPYAKGLYASYCFPGIFSQGGYKAWEQVLEHATVDGRELYRLKNMYQNAGYPRYTEAGHHLIFEWSGDKAIMPQGEKDGNGYVPVATGFLHPSYGMISLTIDPDPAYSYYSAEDDAFIFNGCLKVAQGTLVDRNNDLFLIQERL